MKYYAVIIIGGAWSNCFSIMMCVVYDKLSWKIKHSAFGLFPQLEFHKGGRGSLHHFVIHVYLCIICVWCVCDVCVICVCDVCVICVCNIPSEPQMKRASIIYTAIVEWIWCSRLLEDMKEHSHHSVGPYYTSTPKCEENNIKWTVRRFWIDTKKKLTTRQH